MSDFDPYHIWLGIPETARPISKYRLLGIDDFENNTEVIGAAAERQTIYLRTLQAGEHAVLVADLLNEVSQARVTLLNADQKAEYDEGLRKQQTPEPEEEPVPEQDPLAFAADELAAISSRPATRSRSGAGKPFWQQPWAIPTGAGGIVVLLLLMMLWPDGSGTTDPGKETALGNPKQSSDLNVKQDLEDAGTKEDASKHRFISEPRLSWKAHDQNVFRMLFSPDGRWLATVSRDQTAKLWDVNSGEEVHSLKGHNWEVIWADFSPDSQLLATACRSGRVKLWDVASGRQVRSFDAHGGDVRCVSFNSDGNQLATTGHDNLVRIWNTANGQEINTLKGHSGWGLHLNWSPKGEWIASGSMDKTVKIWDAATGKELLSLSGHPNYVAGVFWSPDGTRLASTSNDTVRVWRVSNGKELYVLRGYTNPCWSPDSRKLVCYGIDASVTVIDGESGKPLQTLTGHVGTSGSAVYSPDGTKISSTSSDNTVWVWEAKTGRPIYTFWGHRSAPKFIKFSPDGKQVVSCVGDGTIKVWDLGSVADSTHPITNSLPPNLEQGLVAYYPFNGNAQDESGNGHHGELRGDPRFCDGITGTAVSLDGDNDHVMIHDPLTPSFPYSWSVWVQPHDTVGGIMLAIQEPPYSWTPHVSLQRNPSGVSITLGHDGGGEAVVVPMPDREGQWLHVVATCSDSGNARLYVNGKLGQSKVGQKYGGVYRYFVVGGYEPTKKFFKNDFDNLRIYNRALSAAEVKSLYEYESKPPNQPDPTAPATESITNTIGMKLKLIPSGSFLMGSPDGEEGRRDDEYPHPVTITKAFYMQTTEVTQGQWKEVMGTEPWKGNSLVKEGPNYPATYVSWNDAVAYCKKLSEKEGKAYRLPTEAEWEYACRAGTETRWSFGDDEKELGDYAWYRDNAWDIDEKYAHQVGLKKPSAFGLYDMHGNVWEWCHDSYGEDYYKQSPENDPAGPASGSSRVWRGGRWDGGTKETRAAHRGWDDPGDRNHRFGFRLVRELD
jgi:WD40 repeat protein/formylglycine-generating enzyme required for sulfatase activity